MQPKQLLSEAELAQLSARLEWRSPVAIAVIWVQMGLAVALVVLWPNPLTWVAALVVIGSRQFSLAIMLHEGAHGLILRNSAANQWVTQWFCAFPIMADNRPYRPYHLKHHRYTETEQDPDLVLSRPFPVSRASMTRKLLRDFTGIAGIRRYYGLLRGALGPAGLAPHRRLAHFWDKMHGFLITNALLFGAFWVAGHPWLYLGLWWLPMLSWYSFIFRVRNIAEHALVPNTNDFDNTRTTLSPAWLRWAVAPLNVNYHLEHHLFVFCPWYNLPAAHRMLMAKGYANRLCLAPSYLGVLRSVVAPA